MKKLPIWAQLAHTPILEVIAVPHSHRRIANGTCSMAHTLAADAHAHGLRLHLFHDDEDRLYVVKLPKPATLTRCAAAGKAVV